MLTVKQQQRIMESKQDRLARIEAGEVMFTDPDEIKWFLNVYKPMPEWEKAELKKAWDKYFKDCGNSVEAQLFREVRKAYKEKDMVRFNDLVDQAREMLSNGIVPISKPAGYDPMIWENAQWAHEWRMLKSELKKSDTSSSW